LLGGTALVSFYWLWPTPARIERQWIEEAGFDPRVAYPDREANDAAHRLEELIAPLGLEISAAPRPIWARSFESDENRYSAVRSEAKDYVRALRRIEPALSAPPAVLADFLRDIEPTLGQVAEVLGGDEPPRWEVRVDRLPDTSRVPRARPAALRRCRPSSRGGREASRVSSALRGFPRPA
jgi:hypothetical protein